MRTVLWLAPLVTLAATAEAQAQSVPVREVGDDTSAVTIIVDASAEQIYRVVTDYANWQQLFTDVEAVQVKSGGREDARVRFKSRIIDQTFTIAFDNTPNQVIRFRGIEGPPGGRARGEYVLTPVGDGSRTRVSARLYMEVTGVAGWFVRDKTIRAMRRAKLAADMNDALVYFARRHAAS